MPVVWQRTNNVFSILVWHSSETIDVLLQNADLKNKDVIDWQSFKSESRKREWLTVRNALKELIPSSKNVILFYDGNGKPLLEDGYISISHSHNYIALMYSKISGIGIDIEIIHPRILKLLQRFLNEKEKEYIIPMNNVEMIHAMWGAKEVLYKIHSLGNIDFKKDLFVHSFSYDKSGSIHASILKKGYEEKLNVFYEQLDGYMLTWAYRDEN